MGLGWVLFLFIVFWVGFSLVKAWATRRLLVVDVKEGRVTGSGGRVPSEVYAEFIDVLSRAKATGRAEVRLKDGSAVVRTSGGIDAGVTQRLRNVIGRFPVARLRAGRPIRHR